MYLSKTLVQEAFLRLQDSFDAGAKAGKEQTTALGVFLAYSEVCKERGITKLDCNHATPRGHEVREDMTNAFSAFLQADTTENGFTPQITSLGYISNEPRPLSKRISSNFLTVGLKRASECPTPKPYPGRPAPLLLIGGEGDRCHGVWLHEDWKANLMRFFEHRKSPTPMTDLAIVMLRDYVILGKKGGNLTTRLSETVLEVFSSDVSDFWCCHIQSESTHRNVLNPATPFAASPGRPFRDKAFCARVAQCDPKNSIVEDLRESINHCSARVAYLENLLTRNHIVFEPYEH